MAEVEEVIRLLIEKEVPEGRKALRDGYENLGNVATYCQHKYSEANNKYKGASDKAKIREETRDALDETKQYATQSLASVAYQINTLALNMLNLLDQQTSQLQSMESQINYISQTVNIHKEKVARREISVLATRKNTTCTHKIIALSKQEKPERYTRKQIDYSILDDIGNGVKLAQTDNMASAPSYGAQATATLRRKPGSRMGLTTKPPPPPVPPPTAPSVPPTAPSVPTVPSVPADYDMTYDSIPTNVPSTPPTPPAAPVISSNEVIVQPPMAPPPPPPPTGAVGHSPPPPPPPFQVITSPAPAGAIIQEEAKYNPVEDEVFYSTPSSLALPLPPEEMPPPPPSMFGDYLEKVISLFTYTAARGDELSFKENTVIYVVKKNDDGWYEGVIEDTGESGLFPENYVALMP